MRRVGVALVLLFWLGSTILIGVSAIGPDGSSYYTNKQSPSEGPTIEWFGLTGTEQLAIAWDGAYTGQTEEVWTHSQWINDSDGVDSVIFRYRWTGETEWMNRTGTLIEGNDTRGYYSANFTYAVWWNYETGRPETEGSGGNFYFKIWANDTLGNWNEVGPMQYMGGYMFVEPPLDYYLWRTPLGWAMIGIPVAIASVVIVLIFRRRT
jgi:hypothetical protein